MDKFTVPLTEDGIPLDKFGLPLPQFGEYNREGERVYYITLHNFEHNESFYYDMETNGGPLHIPDRVIKCIDRCPHDRTTHYLLTAKEAAALSHDPRVAAVELNDEETGFHWMTQAWESTSTFQKSGLLDVNNVNWGIYRHRVKTNPTGWGLPGSSTLTNRTVQSDLSGKNVDVIVIDGGVPWPNTLEWKQNPDGTGYSRFVQFNWNSLSYAATGAVNTSIYSPSYKNDHQAHTAGTVAGNVQGWARDANIYSGYFNDIDFRWAKAFHLNKKVNPLTGIKNPTITNNSYGSGSIGPSSYSNFKLFTSKMWYRGNVYYPTNSTTGANGSWIWPDIVMVALRVPGTFGNGWPTRSATRDAQVVDATKAGVINIVSAGNSYFYIAKPSLDLNDDYNNYAIYNGSAYYYHRGSSPAAANELPTSTSLDNSPISVGAMGASTSTGVAFSYGNNVLTAQDYKSEFSNYGPRVDVYAAGEVVLSVIDNTSYPSGVARDPRVARLGITGEINTDTVSVYALDAGTSMSGPQVCGIVACLLEKYPRMTTKDVRDWLQTMPQTLASTSAGSQNYIDAGSWEPTSNKTVAYLPGTRVKDSDVGGLYSVPWPTVSSKYRGSTGTVWPRTSTLVSRTTNTTISVSVNTATITENNTAIFTFTTTGLSNGTEIPYIIGADVFKTLSSGYIDTTGLSGIYSNAARLTVSGGGNGFNGSILNSTGYLTGHRIVTSTGSYTYSSQSPLPFNGSTGLTSSTVPTSGNNDDGYWTLAMPWNIQYNGGTTSTIYVGTNGYVTFTNGYTVYSSISPSNPPDNKIMLTPGDNSCQRIYYGILGTAPNRTYTVRY